jgi:transposase-like protein
MPGVKTAELCRQHGISEGTFYNWKAKYGELAVPDAKRPKAASAASPGRSLVTAPS